MSEKIESCRLISRETKILQGNTWGKIPALKKIYLMVYNARKILHYCMSGKKFFSKGLGKNSNLNQPPSKVKWSASKERARNRWSLYFITGFFFSYRV